MCESVPWEVGGSGNRRRPTQVSRQPMVNPIPGCLISSGCLAKITEWNESGNLGQQEDGRLGPRTHIHHSARKAVGAIKFQS